MGFPDGDLVDPGQVPCHLRCSICTDTFHEPVFWGGRPCQHVFCKQCILKALERTQECPVCRSMVTAKNLLPHAGFRQFLDELRVHCPKRCGWTGRLDARSAHVKACLIPAVEALQEKIDERNKRLEGLESELESKQGKIAELEAELKAKEEERERQCAENAAEVQRLKSQASGLEEKIAMNRKLIQLYEEKVSNERAGKASLEEQLEKLAKSSVQRKPTRDAVQQTYTPIFRTVALQSELPTRDRAQQTEQLDVFLHNNRVREQLLGVFQDLQELLDPEQGIFPVLQREIVDLRLGNKKAKAHVEMTSKELEGIQLDINSAFRALEEEVQDYPPDIENASKAVSSASSFARQGAWLKEGDMQKESDSELSRRLADLGESCYRFCREDAKLRVFELCDEDKDGKLTLGEMATLIEWAERLGLCREAKPGSLLKRLDGEDFDFRDIYETLCIEHGCDPEEGLDKTEVMTHLSNQTQAGLYFSDAALQELVTCLDDAAKMQCRVQAKKAIFHILDDDGDGRLSIKEMEVFARQTGYNPDEGEWQHTYRALCASHGSRPYVDEALFLTVLDKNTEFNTYCSNADLCDLIRHLPGVIEQRNRSNAIRDIFVYCDTDRDGFLNRRELSKLTRRLGFTGSDAEWVYLHAKLCRLCGADPLKGLNPAQLSELFDDAVGFFSYRDNSQLQQLADELMDPAQERRDPCEQCGRTGLEGWSTSSGLFFCYDCWDSCMNRQALKSSGSSSSA